MEGEKKTKERELREGGEGIKKRVRVKKKRGGEKKTYQRTRREERKEGCRGERGLFFIECSRPCPNFQARDIGMDSRARYYGYD